MEEFALFGLKNLLAIVLLVLIFFKKNATVREKIWWSIMLVLHVILSYFIYLNGEFVCEHRTTLNNIYLVFKIVFFALLYFSLIKNNKI